MREYSDGVGVRGIVGMVGGGVLALILLLAAFGSFFTIRENERGIILRAGAFNRIVQPGLGFKIPFLDSLYRADMSTHTYTYDKMEAYSYDSQPAFLKVSVTLHLNPDKVREFYTRFGADYEAAIKRIVAPGTAQETKIVFGQFNAERVIRQRDQLNQDVGKAVISSIAYDPIFTIERVRIEDIQFSTQYIASVEARMKAEVEVQQYQQQLARERVQAQIKVTQAQAVADSLVAQATAEAQATELRGKAEALAIAARGEALNKNPQLVSLVQAERWNGILPTHMIPGGTIPFMNMDSRPTTPATAAR